MNDETIMRPQILTFEPGDFRVGDRVKLRIVSTDAIGTVIEDRGPLGVDGHHILRLRLDPEFEFFGHEFEMPEEELRRA